MLSICQTYRINHTRGQRYRTSLFIALHHQEICLGKVKTEVYLLWYLILIMLALKARASKVKSVNQVPKSALEE